MFHLIKYTKKIIGIVSILLVIFACKSKKSDSVQDLLIIKAITGSSGGSSFQPSANLNLAAGFSPELQALLAYKPEGFSVSSNLVSHSATENSWKPIKTATSVLMPLGSSVIYGLTNGTNFSDALEIGKFTPVADKDGKIFNPTLTAIAGIDNDENQKKFVAFVASSVGSDNKISTFATIKTNWSALKKAITDKTTTYTVFKGKSNLYTHKDSEADKWIKSQKDYAKKAGYVKKNASSYNNTATVVPRGATLDFTDLGYKITVKDNTIDKTKYIPRDRFNEKHMFWMERDKKWHKSKDFPDSKGGYKLYYSLIQDGTTSEMLLAWLNMKETKTTTVYDGKGNNASKDAGLGYGTPGTSKKDVVYGRDIMLSKVALDGTLSETIVAVEHAQFEETTGGFGGITKVGNKYALVYKKYDFPDRFDTEGKRIEHNTNGTIEEEIKNLAAEKAKYSNSASNINMNRLNIDIFSGYPSKILPSSSTYRGLPRDKGTFLRPRKFYSYRDTFSWAVTARVRSIGNKIAIYSSTGQRSPDGVRHQQDYFQTFGVSTSSTSNSLTPDTVANWEVGHCWHPRMRADVEGKSFVTACIGDSTPRAIRVIKRRTDSSIILANQSEANKKKYPPPGSGADNDILMIDIPHGYNDTGTVLGDLIVIGTGANKRYILIYTSIYGNASYREFMYNGKLQKAGNRDVGVAIFNENLKLLKRLNITKAASHWFDEVPFPLYTMIAPYGDDKALLAWEIITPGKPFTEQGDTYFAIMDKDGNIEKGPDIAPRNVILPVGSEFMVDKDKNIRWAVGKGNTIKIFKFPYKK